MRGTLRSAATLAALALVACALPLSAQTGAARSGSELERLRVSDSLERTGDLAGSEAILRDIMATNPSSLSGLLALERVLRMQGRLEELLEPIEVLLAMDPGSAIGHQARLRTYSGLDRVQDIERAAEAWIRSNPRNEMPYREIARVWRQRGEAKRAAQVMERGRVRIGRGDAIAHLGVQVAEFERERRS